MLITYPVIFGRFFFFYSSCRIQFNQIFHMESILRKLLLILGVLISIPAFAELPWHVAVYNNTDKPILVTAIFGQQYDWKSTEGLGLPRCIINGVYYPNVAGTCIAPGSATVLSTISNYNDKAAYQGFSIYQEPDTASLQNDPYDINNKLSDMEEYIWLGDEVAIVNTSISNFYTTGNACKFKDLYGLINNYCVSVTDKHHKDEDAVIGKIIVNPVQLGQKLGANVKVDSDLKY